MVGVLTLSDSLWKRYRGKPWSNSGTCDVPCVILTSAHRNIIMNSKEHIFDPLGMQTSFLLTPELKERAVTFAYRDENGTLHPWADQIELIERDPTKGM